MVCVATKKGATVNLKVNRYASEGVKNIDEYGFDRFSPHVAYLVDISKGLDRGMFTLDHGCIMFTSPNNDAWKDFAKDNCLNSSPVWMPLWSPVEMKELLEMLKIPETTETKTKMERYGGVPRALLNSDYDRAVTTAVASMDFNQCSAAISSTNATASVRHCLLYYFLEQKGGDFDYRDVSARDSC